MAQTSPSPKARIVGIAVVVAVVAALAVAIMSRDTSSGTDPQPITTTTVAGEDLPSDPGDEPGDRDDPSTTEPGDRPGTTVAGDDGRNGAPERPVLLPDGTTSVASFSDECAAVLEPARAMIAGAPLDEAALAAALNEAAAGACTGDEYATFQYLELMPWAESGTASRGTPPASETTVASDGTAEPAAQTTEPAPASAGS